MVSRQETLALEGDELATLAYVALMVPRMWNECLDDGSIANKVATTVTRLTMAEHGHEGLITPVAGEV